MLTLVYSKLSKFDKIAIETILKNFLIPYELIEINNDNIDSVKGKDVVIISSPSKAKNKTVELLKQNGNKVLRLIYPISKIKNDEDKTQFMQWIIKQSKSNNIITIDGDSPVVKDSSSDFSNVFFETRDGKIIKVGDGEDSSTSITIDEINLLRTLKSLFPIKKFRLVKKKEE